MKKITLISVIVALSIVILGCQWTNIRLKIGNFLSLNTDTANTTSVEFNAESFNASSENNEDFTGDTIVNTHYSGNVTGGDCQIFNPDGTPLKTVSSGSSVNDNGTSPAERIAAGKYSVAKVACLASGSSYNGSVTIQFDGNDAKPGSVTLSVTGPTS